MARLQVSSIISCLRNDAFTLLTSPERLPFLLKDHIEVEFKGGGEQIRRGAEFEFMMTRMGFSQPVRLRVEDVLQGVRVTFRQIEGLFASWLHTIKFEDHGENQTLVTDYVDYRLPLGIIGYVLDDLVVRKDLEKVLASRLARANEHLNNLLLFKDLS